MFRKLLPLAVLVVLVLGCKKKTADTGSDGGTGGGEPAPSGTAYTIKVREPQRGDKLLVTETMKDTSTITIAGKADPKTEQESWEYTETILDMPVGAHKPTKATREYKTAKSNDGAGVMRDLSFAGKTVLLEQKGNKYSFTVNGRALPDADSRQLTREFRKVAKSNKSELQYFLPKGAVKLNEPWALDRETMAQWASEDDVTPDLDASSVTGKLTKVYSKDGKQWGTMEFSLKLVVKSLGADAPPLSGSMTGVFVVDCPIDGSSPASRESMKMTGDLKGTIPQGPITIKGGEDHSRTVTVAK